MNLEGQNDAAFGGKFPGIGHQINQYLRQAVGVGSEHIAVDRTFELAVNSFAARVGGGHDYVLAKLHNVLGSIIELDLPTFERRNIQNIIE